MNQCQQRVGVDCYQFRLTGIGAHLDVTSAHLWLYKTRDVIGHHFSNSLIGGRNQTITVRQIVASLQQADGGTTGRGNYGSRRSYRSRILALMNITRRSGCWIRINIHNAVLNHVERSRRRRPGSLRLAVECRGGCVLARGRPTEVGGADRRPVLVVGTVESRRRRRRRTLDSTCPRSGCCLHRLYIDFARINWTFVKHPHGYYINYCHGPCNCTLSPRYRRGSSRPTGLSSGLPARSRSRNSQNSASSKSCNGR